MMRTPDMLVELLEGHPKRLTWPPVHFSPLGGRPFVSVSKTRRHTRRGFSSQKISSASSIPQGLFREHRRGWFAFRGSLSSNFNRNEWLLQELTSAPKQEAYTAFLFLTTSPEFWNLAPPKSRQTLALECSFLCSLTTPLPSLISISPIPYVQSQHCKNMKAFPIWLKIYQRNQARLSSLRSARVHIDTHVYIVIFKK